MNINRSIKKKTPYFYQLLQTVDGMLRFLMHLLYLRFITVH